MTCTCKQIRTHPLTRACLRECLQVYNIADNITVV